MAEREAVSQFDPMKIDFEQAYRDKTVVEGIPMDRLPWDIGRPQPLLVEFEHAGRITGQVLDIGCGPGDNTIYLASLGYQVAGLDSSPTAIEEARTRAAARDVAVTFSVADATQLDGYDGRFDTVVSSALFHCLAPELRRDHVAALHRVMRPGGRLIQFCFADRGHSEAYTPYQIGEAELRTSFAAPRWSLNTLRTDRMVSIMPPGPVQDMLAERGVELETDETGALLLPIWVLEAERI
ncbi:class I SAM-dependent methyltransferase [Nocardia sp. CA-107356]|uniref:class I SAM-dependent methyltransferase n=1 Tax=Nocardia sp. CA-107356 TaxID=3239972 RepID=UPI003D934C74